MKLIELDPEFLAVAGPTGFRVVESRAEADGLWFCCPKCRLAKGSNVGVHRVICWRPVVPQSIGPSPGRWEIQGSGFEDLSLVAGSSSVRLLSGCEAHFFVTNGEIVSS